jgi:hypothetical protein
MSRVIETGIDADDRRSMRRVCEALEELRRWKGGGGNAKREERHRLTHLSRIAFPKNLLTRDPYVSDEIRGCPCLFSLGYVCIT